MYSKKKNNQTQNRHLEMKSSQEGHSAPKERIWDVQCTVQFIKSPKKFCQA